MSEWSLAVHVGHVLIENAETGDRLEDGEFKAVGPAEIYQSCAESCSFRYSRYVLCRLPRTINAGGRMKKRVTRIIALSIVARGGSGVIALPLV